MSSMSRLSSVGFFRLWAGESISFIGSQVSTFALPLIAVITLKASDWQTSLLVAAGTAANLLLGLSVGVWADRYERRMLMQIANIGRMIVLAAVPVLWWAGALNIIALLIVNFVTGALSLLFASAATPYVSRIVGRDLLEPANSWMQAGEAVGDVGGPGIAGLVVQLLGPPAALLADAISYVASSLALATLPRAAPERAPQEKVERHLTAIAGGLRLLRDDPIQRYLAAASTHFNLFSGMFAALYALFAIRVLGFSPLALGLLTMLAGAAGFAAAAAHGPVSRRIGLGATLIGGYSLPGLTAALVVAAHSAGKPTSYVLVGIAQFCWVFGVVLVLITGGTLRQALVPDHKLGRVTASVRFLAWGSEPVGAIVAGALAATVLGLRGTLLLAAVGLLTAALWPALTPLRRLRTLPDEPVTEQAAVEA